MKVLFVLLSISYIQGRAKQNEIKIRIYEKIFKHYQLLNVNSILLTDCFFFTFNEIQADRMCQNQEILHFDKYT